MKPDLLPLIPPPKLRIIYFEAGQIWLNKGKLYQQGPYGKFSTLFFAKI